MANHTANEAKFTLSPFWMWMVHWGARVAKYILIVPILMGIGYGICARGLGFGAFIAIAFWAFVVIAIVIGVLAPVWRKLEKSTFKDVEQEQPAKAKADTSTENPAYKLGYQDFIDGNQRDKSSFTDEVNKHYTAGYSAALLKGERA